MQFYNFITVHNIDAMPKAKYSFQYKSIAYISSFPLFVMYMCLTMAF